MSTKYIDHRCKKKSDVENLPESVINFAEYLETIKETSPKTVAGYKTDLELLFRFLLIHKKKSTAQFNNVDLSKADEKFIRSIKLSDLYSFLSYCQKERKNTANTRARKVATLKSYFKYLYKKAKIIKENIAEELETPKLPKRQPNVLNVQESLHLLESLDKKNKNYQRDYCILTLFLNCGMRLSELCDIKLEDIKDDILTIVGKGSKERKIYLNETCLKVIEDYTEVRDNSKCTKENMNFLFLSNQSRKISKVRVQNLVKEHLQNAGMDIEKLHTHSMRASFTTIMYKEGVDIGTLATCLGHSSTDTTRRYLNIDEDDLRKVAKNNPLNNR